MISLAVCSNNREFFSQFEKNVASTIGCKYELLKFDNLGLNIGICEVYNNLLRQSSGDIICFVHEDIVFHTNNWGQELKRIFTASDIGLVGTVGASYKPRIPSEWCVHEDTFSYFYIQNNKQKDNPRLRKSKDRDNEAENLVVNLDGLFLCLNSKLKTRVSFDEKLQGFHAYDTDICLSVIKQGYKVLTTNQILLEHFSEGSHSKEWLKNHIQCNLKWKKMLPISIENGKYLKKGNKNIDIGCYYNFKDDLKTYSFSRLEVWKYEFIFSLKPIHQEFAAQFLMLYSYLKKKIIKSY